MQKVALLSTRGLPARYGAFEQTVYKLVEENVHSEQPLHYFVGTDLSLEMKNLMQITALVLIPRVRPGLVLFYMDC